MKLAFAGYCLALIALSEVLYFLYAFYFFDRSGWLPPPFYFDVYDTFIDFYATLYWSLDEGRYEVWRSIYPMFPFLLGRLMVSPECLGKVLDPFELRSCDPNAVAYLVVALFLGSVIVAGKLQRVIFPAPLIGFKMPMFILIWISVLISVPGLMAIERGNFIIFAFLALSLVAARGYGIVSAVCLALAISVKQYLVVLLIVPYVKQQFGYMGLVISGVVGLQLIALLFVPESHPDLLLENMVGFNNETAISYFDKIWNPTSIQAWTKVFENSQEILKFLSFDSVNFMTTMLVLLGWAIRLSFLLGVLFMFNPRVRELDGAFLMFYLLVGLLVSTDSIGGYGLLLLVPFWGAAFRHFSATSPLSLG